MQSLTLLSCTSKHYPVDSTLETTAKAVLLSIMTKEKIHTNTKQSKRLLYLTSSGVATKLMAV